MSTTPLRLSRRQALGLAGAGAAAAAGARLGLIRLGRPASGIASAAGPAGAWASPLGDRRALAAHLLRRAGLGYNATELDAAATLSYGDLVEKLITQTPEEPARPPSDRLQYQKVTQWWVEHMATTGAQFPERMLLFWHGVLTSDYRKSVRQPSVYQQNQLYRRLGSSSDLATFLKAVTTDPLMMRYLDLDKSSAKAPNENFAREVMELYTLGTGAYTETDVREGARALCGLRVVLVDRDGKRITPPRYTRTDKQGYATAVNALLDAGASYRGVLAKPQHDGGEKTFLGRTGNLGPQDVIDAILAKDACATFIATRALVYFCTPQPSADLVGRVAGQFRSSKYDMRSLMRAIFLAPEFRDAANYRSLVRSPVDYMVATMRALHRSDLVSTVLPFGVAMDQVLYDPPTVAGWPTNSGWLSSSTLLARLNLAQAVVEKVGTSLPDPVEAVRTQLDGVVGPATAEVFNASTTTGDRWYAVLGAPEFHLK